MPLGITAVAPAGEFLFARPEAHRLGAFGGVHSGWIGIILAAAFADVVPRPANAAGEAEIVRKLERRGSEDGFRREMRLTELLVVGHAVARRKGVGRDVDGAVAARLAGHVDHRAGDVGQPVVEQIALQLKLVRRLVVVELPNGRREIHRRRRETVSRARIVAVAARVDVAEDVLERQVVRNVERRRVDDGEGAGRALVQIDVVARGAQAGRRIVEIGLIGLDAVEGRLVHVDADQSLGTAVRIGMIGDDRAVGDVVRRLEQQGRARLGHVLVVVALIGKAAPARIIHLLVGPTDAGKRIGGLGRVRRAGRLIGNRERIALAVPMERGDAQSRLVTHRHVDGRFELQVVIVAELHARIAAGVIHRRSRRHEQHRAARRVASEQRALRALQHLHRLQVEERRGQGRDLVGRRERHVCEIGLDRTRGGAEELAATADREAGKRAVARIGVDLQAGNRLVQGEGVRDPLLLQRGLREGGDCHRHTLHILLAAPRGHDDVVHRGRFLLQLRGRRAGRSGLGTSGNLESERARQRARSQQGVLRRTPHVGNPPPSPSPQSLPWYVTRLNISAVASRIGTKP